MKRILPLILISSFIIGLSACAQTGPLYLPEKDEASSGSTIAASGSSINQNQPKTSTTDQTNNGDQGASTNSDKIDNDPTPPAQNYDPATNELVDTGDNFGYDKNIQDSSEAGGNST